MNTDDDKTRFSIINKCIISLVNWAQESLLNRAHYTGITFQIYNKLGPAVIFQFTDCNQELTFAFTNGARGPGVTF